MPMHQDTLTKLNKYVPWLSLIWGISSIPLITHNVAGIHKVLLFGAVFAAVSLLGLALPKNKLKPLHWIKTTSRRSSAQYILFFALPLLWKAHQWSWLILLTVVALSTLWDPLYEKLWQRSWYRTLLVTVCFAIVSALSIVTWIPHLLEYTLYVCIGVCVVSQLSLLLTSQNFWEHTGKERLMTMASREWLSSAILFAAFSLSGAPLPAVGVWLVTGKIEVQTEIQTLECVSQIAAPSGFRSEIIHHWTIVGERSLSDEVRLSEIFGNGIDEKPFTTRSRKKSFPFNFDELKSKNIRCTVVIPGHGSIGYIETLKK